MSPKDWPYSAGKNATRTEPSSRVRVYDRRDIPGRIFMSRAWVKTESGRPAEVVLPEGYTRERARLLAIETATQRRIAIIEGRTSSGDVAPVTLGDLLDQYHRWLGTQDRSPKTLDDKDRCRLFWLAAVGGATPVLSLRADRVEALASQARKAGRHTARWDRKRLAYLRAAVRWGMNKAQLYDLNPLRGLELPEYHPDTTGKEYDARESMLLATPHPDVDWRVTLLASIICDTGRRISAVLTVSAVRDLVIHGDRLHILFRRDFDKGKRDALVPVSAETHLLIAAALDRPEVVESGWLIPEGRTDYADPTDKPFNKDAATSALHRAEAALGIPYVAGRAFHGLKRTHVTTSWEEAGGDAALVGDITGHLSPKLLKDTYRRLNRGRTEAHVDKVRARLKKDAES